MAGERKCVRYAIVNADIKSQLKHIVYTSKVIEQNFLATLKAAGGEACGERRETPPELIYGDASASPTAGADIWRRRGHLFSTRLATWQQLVSPFLSVSSSDGRATCVMLGPPTAPPHACRVSARMFAHMLTQVYMHAYAHVCMHVHTHVDPQV